MPIRLEVLGPTRLLLADGTVVELTTSQRRLLCRLAAEPGRPIPLRACTEAMWDHEPPASAAASLHNQVSRIRSRAGVACLDTGTGWIALQARTDANELTHLVTALDELAAADPEAAFVRCDGVLGQQRGAPFADLEHRDDIAALALARADAAEHVRAIATIRLSAAIALDRWAWAVPEARRLVAASPLDERRAALLVEALDRAGRRGEALAAFEQARRRLADELGIAPGRLLHQAAERVLEGGTAGQAPRPTSTIVGRDELVTTVVDQLSAGHHVVLAGEPGMGRSTIVEVVAGRLRRLGANVGTTTCARWPASALESLQRLATSMAIDLDPMGDPVQVFAGAMRERRSAAGASPAVVVVDDLHHAGPTTIAAVRAAAEVGALVVATVVQPDSADVLGLDVVLHELAPLEPAHLAELGGNAQEVDPVWLHAMSGGNPLLAIHLVDQASGPGGSLRSTPPPLRSLVRERLDALDPAGRAVIDAAAVLGEVAEVAVAAQLVGRSWTEGLTQALGAALLEAHEEGRTVRFRHGAVHRVVYDALPPGRRQELHHHAAQVLRRSQAPIEVVARHAVRAADIDLVRAATDALAAAAAATAAGAHPEAATWAQAAVSLLPTSDDGPPEVVQLAITAAVCAGDALRLAGDPGHEAALLHAARRAMVHGEPGLIGQAAFAVLQLGATTSSGHWHDQAATIADAALEAVVDGSQRALLQAATSLLCSMTDQASRSRELFLQAIEVPVDPDTRRAILPFAFLAIGHPRDLQLRAVLADELLTLGVESGDLVAACEAHQMLASVAIQRGDGAGLRSAAAQLRHLAERTGDIGRRWGLLFTEAAVAHLDGDFDRCEELAGEALELFSPVSPSRALAAYSGQLFVLRWTQGRLGELHGALVDLVAEQPDVPAWHAALALATASVTSSGGHASASIERDRLVLDHVERAITAVAEDFTWLATHLVAAHAAASVGASAEAAVLQELYDRLAPFTGQLCWQGTCCYGPVDGALGALAEASGQRDRAAEHRLVAAERCRSLGTSIFG